MRKWKALILIVVVLAIAVIAFRIYTVNKDVAREYDIERFSVGDSISLGDAILTVKSVSYGDEVEVLYDQEWLNLNLEMELENISDKSLSTLKIIESKLAYGMDVYQTNQGEFDTSSLQELKPGATENILLTYNIKAEQEQENGEIYLSQDLFKELVKSKYEEGKRYGIVIEL